eukprot:gene3653-biopygen1882
METRGCLEAADQAKAAGAVTAAALRRGRAAAEGLLRIPTCPMIAWVVLAQGPTYAGSKLLRVGGAAGHG